MIWQKIRAHVEAAPAYLRTIATGLSTVIKEQRTMIQVITDLVSAEAKLELAVTALEGRVLGTDDLQAIAMLAASMTALAEKITQG